jgi:hypothetical protein
MGVTRPARERHVDGLLDVVSLFPPSPWPTSVSSQPRRSRAYRWGEDGGNHGEDVKEYYFYLDSTPTHSYMQYLYKYPQAAYPYALLVETNKKRSHQQMEYELLDTGVFDDNVTSTCSSNTRRPGRKTSSSRSPSRIAARTPRRCTSCLRSGSATPRAGRRARRSRCSRTPAAHPVRK